MRMALRGNYDLMVLDVVLPDLSGFDVLRQLRQSSVFQAPAVIVSGGLVDFDPERDRELGIVDHIPKPFGIEIAPRLLSHIARAPLSISISNGEEISA